MPMTLLFSASNTPKCCHCLQPDYYEKTKTKHKNNLGKTGTRNHVTARGKKEQTILYNLYTVCGKPRTKVFLSFCGGAGQEKTFTNTDPLHSLTLCTASTTSKLLHTRTTCLAFLSTSCPASVLDNHGLLVPLSLCDLTAHSLHGHTPGMHFCLT